MSEGGFKIVPEHIRRRAQFRAAQQREDYDPEAVKRVVAESKAEREEIGMRIKNVSGPQVTQPSSQETSGVKRPGFLERIKEKLL